MAETRTFRETGGGIFGSFASIFVPLLAIGGIGALIAPLRWSGTSPVLSTALGLGLLAAAYGLRKLSRHLGQTALIVRRDGVEIQGPWSTRQLRWEQIARFHAGTAPAVTQARPIQVVVAELTDGSEIPIDALRVDHGPMKTKEDRARVERLCAQIEALRPQEAAIKSGSR